jgi:uncharacterized protein YndB with AHSA1/START domain
MASETQLIFKPDQQNYTVIREFNAAREKVFLAFTQPELYARWFMPAEYNLTIEIMNAVSGGTYKHTHYQGDAPFSFYGVFHEVSAPELIIKTSEFIGLPFKVQPVLEMIQFDALSPQTTRVIIEAVCPSINQRDAMVNAGMKPTLDITFQQLDSILTQ